MAGLFLDYAHRLPVLADNLAAALRPRLHNPTSLFNPVDIIVPNATMQSYLEQELARQLGVTPNIRFRRLRSYLAQALSPARGDDSGPAPRILGADALQHILVDVLHDAHLNPLPDCEALSAYLDVKDARDQPHEAARELRLYQLSEELARIFTEYSFSRSASLLDPAMHPAPLLVRWSRDELQDPENSIERWQKALWRHIFGHGGVLDEINARAKADGQAPYIVLSKMFFAFKVAPARQLPERVYMVGFPHIARIFVEAIQLLSCHTEVHLFALTPAQKWAESTSSELTESDHPLLRRWARAGQIHATVWAGTGARIQRLDPAASAPTTLLRALQDDIIAPSAPPALARQPAGSQNGLRFFECPSIAREVEAVTNEIWALLNDEKQGELRPDDIAVLIAGADQQSYQLQLTEAFRSFHNLPFKEVGLPAAGGGRVLDAAKLLLNLPFGRFRRAELLKLLVHPNLRGRGEEIDPSQWARWCDKLGILYAANRDEQTDSYLGDDTERRWDLYNWDQGIRRVVLGHFLSGERSGVDRLFEMCGSDYQPLEVSDSASATTSNFVALVRSIMADARWLRGPDHALTQRPASEWASIVEDYFRTYLQVSTQAEEHAQARRQEDSYYLGAACRAIRKIGENCPTRGKISYRIFREFAAASLEALRKVGGHHLSGGVVVSTLLEARALPFKHIFVLGLGEGQFPNPESRDALDLRQSAPRLGDLTPSDRDRYAFLETLLAAGESLTLSWVAREATTGDALNASSVVNELRWVLQSRFGIKTDDPTRTDALTVVHPLRRYDASLFEPENAASHLTPNMHPRAFEERRISAFRASVAAGSHGQKPRVIPTLDELLRGEDALLTPKLRGLLKLPALPSQLPSIEDAPKTPALAHAAKPRVRLQLSTLRDFLESPLQAAAKFQLGLREDEEDLFNHELEPLQANSLYKAIHLRRVIEVIIKDSDYNKHDIRTLYNRLLIPEAPLKGELPSGYFLAKDRDAHCNIIETWRANLKHFNISGALACDGIGLADPSFRSAAPAIEFVLNPPHNLNPSATVDIELVGRTDFRTSDGSAQISFVVSDADNAQKRFKYLARGFVTFAATIVAGLHAIDQPIKIIVNSAKAHTARTKKDNFCMEITSWRDQFDITPVEYLQNLTRALLFSTHDYLLPVEFAADVFAQLQNSKLDHDSKVQFYSDDAFQEWLEDKLSAENPRISSQYGPIQDYRRFGAPRRVDGLRAMLDTRFPYLCWSES